MKLRLPIPSIRSGFVSRECDQYLYYSLTEGEKNGFRYLVNPLSLREYPCFREKDYIGLVLCGLVAKRDINTIQDISSEIHEASHEMIGNALKMSIIVDHMDIMITLLNNYGCEHIDITMKKQLLCWGILFNNHQMCKFVISLGTDNINIVGAIYVAVTFGRINILEYLYGQLTHKSQYPNYRDVLKNASRYNQMDVKQWIINHYQLNPDDHEIHQVWSENRTTYLSRW